MQKNKFRVIGTNKSFGFRTILIIILFSISIFIAFFFTNTLLEIILILIIFLIVLIILLYVCYYSFQEKKFLIDNNGIRYFYKDQIKKEVKWKDVKKIKSGHPSKYLYNTIIERRNGSEFVLNTGLCDLDSKDVIRAFREILKCQSKYDFIVEDYAGWAK